MRLRVPNAALAVAVTLALAACGSSPTAGGGGQAESSDQGAGAARSSAEDVFAELSRLSGQDRRDTLVKRAEEEGALSIYTSMNAEVADELIGEFEDTFDLRSTRRSFPPVSRMRRSADPA